MMETSSHLFRTAFCKKADHMCSQDLHLGHWGYGLDRLVCSGLREPQNNIAADKQFS
jgi:hypothetical protein